MNRSAAVTRALSDMHHAARPTERRAKPLGIYVHVPWCRARCDYCGFVSLTIAAATPGRLRAVIEQTLSLLDQRVATVAPTHRIDTVYVGGGTPTVLPHALLRRLLDGIADRLGRRTALREWTVEANPDTIDASTLELLADCGVTRLSVGVQSFQSRLLQVIGRCRVAGADGALPEVLDLIGRSWSGQWSLDLITSIPGMSPAEARLDVRRACEAGPHHISLYDLSLEPGTRLANRLGRAGATSAAADGATVAGVCTASATAAARELERRGYRRYEISNYAIAGCECRHNQNYWTLGDYIGVGPSAVSAIRRPEGGIVRYSDAATAEGFLNQSGPWGTAEESSPAEAAFERLMVGLRTAEGVSLSEVMPLLAERAEVRQVFERWSDQGLATIEAEVICMTRRGWDLLDSCLRDLL